MQLSLSMMAHQLTQKYAIAYVQQHKSAFARLVQNCAYCISSISSTLYTTNGDERKENEVEKGLVPLSFLLVFSPVCTSILRRRIGRPISYIWALLMVFSLRRICDPADCLNYLLPNERSSEVVLRLRQPNLLPGVICRTNRYFKSFLPYALNNYKA